VTAVTILMATWGSLRPAPRLRQDLPRLTLSVTCRLRELREEGTMLLRLREEAEEGQAVLREETTILTGEAYVIVPLLMEVCATVLGV